MAFQTPTEVGAAASPDTINKAALLAAASESEAHTVVEEQIAGSFYDLVKGWGMKAPGGHKPLEDPNIITAKAAKAHEVFDRTIKETIANPGAMRERFRQREMSGHAPGLLKSFPGFGFDVPGSMGPHSLQFQELIGALQDSGSLNKDFTLSSPLSTSFAPFDLVSPARLIYPIFAPFRNKIPRTPGQGIAHRTKLITGIPGSQSGGANGAFFDTSIGELPVGQSFGNNWPMQLPPSGPAETAIDTIIPLRYFGVSENLSWLSQIAAQGFQDLAGLANLILMQKAILNEEGHLLFDSATALTAPGQPSGTARTAQSNETGLSGVTTDVYVIATALNAYGQTVGSTASAAIATTNGQVVDVTIPHGVGAASYNLYVTTGASPGTYHLMASGIGGTLFTLQGAIPTTGATPPTADTGSAAATRMEGIIPVLSGLSQSGGSNIYPTGFQGGYYLESAGVQLSETVLATALSVLYNGGSTGNGFKGADPDEVVQSAIDTNNLAQSILTAAQAGYQIRIDHMQSNAIQLGSAVSTFVNPVTRKTVSMVVHPYLPQGTCLIMQYGLPNAYSNVQNVWENVMAQDYVSIGWPAIDLTWRYSLVYYGSLVCNAAGYCGIIQGLQASGSKPYS